MCPLIDKRERVNYNSGMKKKTILWILIFAAVVLGGLLLYRHLSGTGGTVAVISVNGEVMERIDLSKVRESYDLQFDTPWGRNTVHVAPGAISVSEADCPDQICVKHNHIRYSKESIVCLPNKVVVTVEGGEENEIDGSTF